MKREDIDKVLAELNELKCKTLKDVEEARVRFLGKKGEITALFDEFRTVDKDLKREFGRTLNELKQKAQETIDQLKSALEDSASQAAPKTDLSMPGDSLPLGSRHPVSIVRQEIVEIFRKFGYDVAEGPEIEDDYHVFEALNFPPNHPARDMQDTYYLTNGQLLKSQTSAAQNAILRKYRDSLINDGTPIKAIFPGRCFRNEATDACHENTFFQMEGMMVGKDISISNLIYFMKTMLSEVFQKDIKVRLRPGFFPFVEPGFELDISCLICGGEGCPSCKHSGWLELCPCGMIHPEVMRMGGIDPEEYTGFAFGLGLTRLVMMKYGIKDIRDLNGGSLKAMSQFTDDE